MLDISRAESVLRAMENGDWTRVLEHAKQNGGGDDNSSLAAAFLSSLLRPFHDQLSAYAYEMSMAKEKSNLSTAQLKELVLQTRSALRFGLFCVTPRDDKCDQDDNASISDLQTLAVKSGLWTDPLGHLLCQRRGDIKCRMSAARLLCNLITANPETAAAVTTAIPLSPSPESITSSIRQSLMAKDGHDETRKEYCSPIQSSWVDMILAASQSKQREVLAAVVAALHNAVVALPSFAESVASDSMLLNTLLRNFVSAETVVEAIKNSNATDPATTPGHTSTNNWDSATDWIQLLLAKLAILGWLPLLYQSISSSSETTVVVPEQNVLLHCMAREADSYVMEFASNKDIANPFGGERGMEKIMESYNFLASSATILSSCLHYGKADVINSSDVLDDSFGVSLMESGYESVLDILRSTLGVDSTMIGKVRENIGQHTTLVQDSAKSLGVITDMLAERSVGKRSRDVRLTDTEQRLLTNLVCLIGNLCYTCKQNQDLLRLTLIPPTDSGQIGDECKTETGTAARNGLHVLLSCTSYATSCFTLREWGVIAVRNALEDNADNQAIVAQLVAQNPVQSADLENAGVRVQLDSKGKVSLSKIDAGKDQIVEEEEEEEDNDTS